MNFELNDDQRMLTDSVDRLLTLPTEGRWAHFAEMGLLGLPIPDSAGGFGGGGVESMLVMEAIGRTLAPEPYLSAVLLVAGLLAEDERQSARLAQVMAGEARWTIAFSEPQGRYDLADIATSATQDGDNWVLQGRKVAVIDLDPSCRLLVVARTSGRRTDEEGATLFALAVDAPGLEVTYRRTPDGRRSAELTLSSVRVSNADRVGPLDGAMPLLRRAVDRAIAGACAEAVGAMAHLLDITVDYLKTRRQFGQPIGAFQALQHRAADMLVEVELARSMAMYAAGFVDETREIVRRSAIAAAKVQVIQSARFVGQQAIQLHGGIGMSEEHVAGSYFKRLTQFERLLGDEDHFLREIDRCGGIGLGAIPSSEHV